MNVINSRENVEKKTADTNLYQRWAQSACVTAGQAAPMENMDS